MASGGGGDAEEGWDSKHYDVVSDSYQSAWFYQTGTPFETFLSSSFSELLCATPDSFLVDLGGGTGAFTSRLRRDLGLRRRALVVDPSQGLLNGAAEFADDVETLLADADGFLGKLATAEVDPPQLVILKEVVHHVPRWASVASSLYSLLPSPSRVVIMTRPPTSHHFPFFPAAHDEWARHQEPPSAYAGPLEAAGFGVEVVERAYGVDMAKQQWLDMMRGRFWSTFSAFGDDELEEGVRRVDREHPGERLAFEDRLCFIVAVKA